MISEFRNATAIHAEKNRAARSMVVIDVQSTVAHEIAKSIRPCLTGHSG
jgi:hypothetical protein